MRPILLIVPLLAACAAPSQWSKPGASDSAMAEDLQQCRAQARLSPPRAILDTPVAQSSSAPLMDRGQERDAQEDQQIRHCMQGKGYSLRR